MSDYPERISISPVHRQKRDDDFYLVDRKAFPGKGVEYVRSDMVTDFETHPVGTGKRIEELEAELRDTQDRANAFATKEYYTEIRAELAEAKLARAVEQMQRVKDFRYDPNIGIVLNLLEATLAELKGQDEP